MLHKGMALAHYRLEEKIGQGGMGIVWKALDTRLNRPVAIKLLPADLARDGERLARFRREAQALAALNHPGIVTIHSVEEAGEIPFITMELIQGKTLEEFIPAGGMSAEALLDLAIPVADALRVAHLRQIAHRDLKPANIMIGEDGRPKILDFGLAKVQAPSAGGKTTETPTATDPGVVMGTVPYMSPEQIRGNTVDHRSDLFSFGVILYRMATGDLPFTGGSAGETISSILRDDPVPVSSRRPDAPVGLERLIGRCLEKRPEIRVSSAEEILESLREIRGAPGESARRPAPSIAVLPFADMSPGKDQDYFCEGMAEEILNSLSRIPGLHVASRTSAFQFKGAAVDSREVGRRLGVGAFLEGSIRKAGDRIRISAQLINAADGYQLWSDRYDRELRDVFQVQDEISGAIVETLKIKLLGGTQTAVRRPRNPDLEAYSLNLKGRFFWSQRTEEGLLKGIDCFQQAIEKDPDYALAHAGLADSCALLCSYHLAGPAESIPRAAAAARRAKELDESLAEAWEALAHVKFLHDWSWTEAEADLRRALDLNPGFATAHQRLAILLGLLGRLDEAGNAIARAELLDPLSLIINTDAALLAFLAGDYRRAADRCRGVLEVAPRFGVAGFLLGLASGQEGRHDEAVNSLEEAIRASGDLTVMIGALGHAQARAGRSHDARKTLERLRNLSPGRYVSPYSLATVHAGLGEWDEALSLLKRSVEQRSVWLIHLHMKDDPRLEPLRTRPAFQALLEAMNLPPAAPSSPSS